MRVNLPGACGTHFFPGHVTTTTSTDNGCVMGWRLLVDTFGDFSLGKSSWWCGCEALSRLSKHCLVSGQGVRGQIPCLVKQRVRLGLG